MLRDGQVDATVEALAVTWTCAVDAVKASNSNATGNLNIARSCLQHQ